MAALVLVVHHTDHGLAVAASAGQSPGLIWLPPGKDAAASGTGTDTTSGTTWCGACLLMGPDGNELGLEALVV